MGAWRLKLFIWSVEAFQAHEGVGADEGVTVGYVFLPASGLPVAVLLGKVLAVELSEGNGFGVVLIPEVKFVDELFVLVPSSKRERLSN